MTGVGAGVRRVSAPHTLVLVWLAALVALLLAATLTGAAAPLSFADPGPLVRWGIPVLEVAGNLAAASTVGSLVLAAVALPATRPERSRPRALPQAFLLATVAAATWAITSVLLLVLNYVAATGVALDDPDLGSQLGSFATTIDLGRQFAVTVAVAAAVATFAAGARTLRAAGLLAVLSLVGLVPPALSGHAAVGNDHETAVTSLGLHLLGVTVWVGGLLALVLLWRTFGRDADAAARTVSRYSTLAGWSFVFVALSGAINAWIRIGGWGGLHTRYGVLVLLKVAVLAGLGVLGLVHRRRTIPALQAGRPGAFVRLAGGEVLLMGVAIGFAAALSRSAPPVPEVPPPLPTLAQSITGYPMPPEPSALRWLDQWQPDLLWLTVALLAVGWYLVAARRLRVRGDRWPLWRTALWVAGWAVLTYATSGPPIVYGRVLFSAHMIAHMTLSMVVPMFLVSAAPVTLALRALPARHDGTRGPREWLLAVVESGVLRVLATPAVAFLLFGFSLYLFYFSPLLTVALTTHVGHEVMHLHFLLAGYLFMYVLMGADPGPPRPSPPLRMVLLLASMAFHAFFGVTLMMSRSVLAPDYFGGLGREWGRGLLEDQQYGGGLAWGIGELPTLVVALVIALQWARSDDREARRRDRAADRDGDAELAAYNAMLARMSGQDRP